MKAGWSHHPKRVVVVLAALVVLAMPTGTIWAAWRRPPVDLPRRATRTGSIASLSLCALYAAIITGVSVNSLA